jgi:hypothetical protein
MLFWEEFQMRSIKLSPLISALIFYAGAILLIVGPAAHGAVM